MALDGVSKLLGASSFKGVKAVRWEEEQRQKPAEEDWDAGEEELLSLRVITRLSKVMRENAVLAEIFAGVENYHTTQGFETAEELAAAFKGGLESVNEATIQERVAEAHRKYETEIRMHGITDAKLHEMFSLVWIYSRLTHPVNALLEDTLAKMEGMEAARVFASGLGSIEATILQFTRGSVEWDAEQAERRERDEEEETKKTDHIVVVGNIYGGTNADIKDLCKRTGRTVTFYTIEEFEALMKRGEGLPENTGLVFAEGSNNPTLEVTPIDLVAQAAHAVGAKLACDMTFTPLTINAKSHGADLVLHSMTKYVGGKSEDLGGFVSGSQEDMDKLIGLHNGRRMLGGAIMAPRVARKFLENVRDLPERLYWGSKNARAVSEIGKRLGFDARTVEDYPNYQALRNPDLPAEVTNGMVALYLDDQAQAIAFVNAMIKRGIGLGAVSLGATKTYYCIPSMTTHSELKSEEQQKQRITPGLVRISCGIEENLAAIVKEVLLELKDPHSGVAAEAA